MTIEAPGVDAVALAITRAHFGMAALLARLHGEEGVSGTRALLINLAELGPRTVPQLAAMRPVSRQYIQKLVDGMAAAGLVEKRTNAAHKRSPLIALTGAGRQRLQDMRAREAAVFEGLSDALSAGEAAELVAALERITARVGEAAAGLPDAG
jgi:DNA-binding MarR family transcriptional regulator